MELTWLAATSLVLVGVGYGCVQRAQRSRLVCWGLLCTSLFLLATRDLLRSRGHGRHGPSARAEFDGRRPSRTDVETTSASDRDRGSNDGSQRRRPLFARVRRRIGGWLP